MITILLQKELEFRKFNKILFGKTFYETKNTKQYSEQTK